MTIGVGRRVAATFALMVFLLAAHNVLLFHYFTRADAYGPFLELAGRQRYLAQRLRFLVERSRGSLDAGLTRAIQDAIESVDQGLSVLEDGGEAFGYQYPAAPVELSGSLRVQREVWDELRPRLLSLIVTSPGSRSGGSSAETGRLVEELTQSSFGLVDGIESWRKKLRRNLFYSIVGTSVLALLTLGAAFRLAWEKIVRPVRELRDEALRVSENGSHENPGDEIGIVSTVVTEMWQSVGRLRHERERVERELRRVEADYRSVFDNAVAGIFQFNAAGELILANPAMARILGYDTPAELAESVQNVHRDMFADSDHESRVWALVGGGGIIESQTRMIRRDGSVLWALESSSVVRCGGGDYCCETVVVDVTEMRKAQEGLRELSGLLLESQERERRRIARELHDSTGQVLAALEMNLSRLQDLLRSACDALGSTGDLATQCSREIRSMSYLLHPPLLDELGLAYAVRDYVDGFAKRAGIEVDLQLPSEMERLSQDAEIALFRVVQEALTNIHRHAESRTAKVEIRLPAGAVVVEVEDEGRGIPPELLGRESQSLSRMGVGMRGMEERLRQLGGCLTITSSPGSTRVRAEIPRSNTAERHLASAPGKAVVEAPGGRRRKAARLSPSRS